MPARSLLPLAAFLLIFMQPGPPVHAQDEGELEGWQRRILEALEESERSRGAARDDERRALTAPGRGDPGASAAAARAQQIHGGQPLAVVRFKGGYRVRLLLDSGRVTTVEIRD